MEDSEQVIREHAYRIWEQEGHPQGRQQEHWVRAEQELDCYMVGAKTANAEHAPSSTPEAKSAKRKRSTGRQPARPKRKTSTIERV